MLIPLAGLWKSHILKDHPCEQLYSGDKTSPLQAVSQFISSESQPGRKLGVLYLRTADWAGFNCRAMLMSLVCDTRCFLVALAEHTALWPPHKGTHNRLKAVWVQKRNHVRVSSAWHLIKGIINSCWWSGRSLSWVSSVQFAPVLSSLHSFFSLNHEFCKHRCWIICRGTKLYQEFSVSSQIRAVSGFKRN